MIWRVDERDQLAPGTWWSDGQRICHRRRSNGTQGRGEPDRARIPQRCRQRHDPQPGGREVRLASSERGNPGMDARASGSRGENWLIENVEARLNHAAGIAAGDSTTIRNVTFPPQRPARHHRARRCTNILIEVIGDQPQQPAWIQLGLGGRRRQVHPHHRPGFPQPHRSTTTSAPAYGPTSTATTRPTRDNYGLQQRRRRASSTRSPYDAVIRGNEVYDNGFIKAEWLWGSGILIAASTEC